MSKRIVSASLAVRASLHRARAARVCVTALAPRAAYPHGACVRRAVGLLTHAHHARRTPRT
jgi:hypothetical protein